MLFCIKLKELMLEVLHINHFFSYTPATAAAIAAYNTQAAGATQATANAASGVFGYPAAQPSSGFETF